MSGVSTSVAVGETLGLAGATEAMFSRKNYCLFVGCRVEYKDFPCSKSLYLGFVIIQRKDRPNGGV